MSAVVRVGADVARPIMVAPCGMHCGVCYCHLREKNRCLGCNGDDASKPKHCLVCRIRHCEEAVGRDFCYQCARFPCARLRQMDKRYRDKYKVSLVDNLESVRDIGLDAFLAAETERWTCAECGGTVCVHTATCSRCGHTRPAET